MKIDDMPRPVEVAEPPAVPIDSTAGGFDVERPSRARLAAIVLWILQVLTLTLMLPLAVSDVESIVGTGPILTVIGLLLAVVAAALGSWAALVFGLSGPLMCMLAARSIAHFHWNPSEASRPIPILLGVCVVLTLPVAAGALVQILRSRQTYDLRLSFARSYSLKSLLTMTTVVCVVVAGVRSILAYAVPGDYFIFDIFNLTVAVFSCAAVYLFVSRHFARSAVG